MERNGALGRKVRTAAVTAAALTLAAACSGGPAPGSTGSTPGTPSATAPGSLTAAASGVDLVISGAVVHRATGELTMTVRNTGTVPEHLAVVLTRTGERAALRDTGGATPAPAGVLLRPGSTTAFQGGGPQVLLPAASTAKAGGTVPVMLEFAVVGLVRMQVPVSGS